MTTARAEPDGRIVVESPRYRLEVAANGVRALLTSPEGRHWATLRLISALDVTGGVDETLEVSLPRIVDGGIEIGRRSTLWERAGLTVVCDDDTLELRSAVVGRGDLTEVHLLGGRSLVADRPSGFYPTGSSFRTLFSPNPGDPGKLVRSAAESAVIGVSGNGDLGRGHWFFTPAPLYLALTTADVSDPTEPVEDGWVGVALAAPVQELSFVQLAYVPADRAFSLMLDYEGHTRVDGEFRGPTVLISPGAHDPYAGLRRHRDELAARGFAPEPEPRDVPAWWREPMFCGWGSQCYLARTTGTHAPAHATQERYDGFLDHLEREGVVPGTIVIDDKWQSAYGTDTPDTAKWPDLKGWIAGRHERGQRVLLWWKAWDAEGAPAELCVRTLDGAPVALDPTNPGARELLRESLAGMLAPDGLDADGLKIDFTARTPSGRSLSVHGSGWGISLLHELLEVVYEASKDAKREALLITQTPHPSFVDVTDMLRLNDMLRLDDPGPRPPVVPQMRYRAGVAHAACPEVLVDTDDWCVPDLETWRAFLAIKSELGVPSLYYATHLDWSGEQLEQDDYRALRETWQEWRGR